MQYKIVSVLKGSETKYQPFDMLIVVKLLFVKWNIHRGMNVTVLVHADTRYAVAILSSVGYIRIP